MSAATTFRHYRISQDELGAAIELWRGETEIVCLAVDTLRQVFVELHVSLLDAETSVELKALQQLTKSASALRHPNVLEIIDSGEDEGALYTVTEYVDGERLDTFLARNNTLPTWLTLQLLMQMADGLCALQDHPRLLANLELFTSAVHLLGEGPTDMCIKLADFRLPAVPSKEMQDSASVRQRLICDLGRVAAYMLTGAMPQGIPTTRDLIGIPAELAFLITALCDSGHHHHPRDFPQVSKLMDRCIDQLSPEQASIPAKLTPNLRPRLPLAAHFNPPAAIAEALSNDYVVSANMFDAVQPYEYSASHRETRTAVKVQVFPPDRLMTRDFLRIIRSARDRINGLDHPHLLRILVVDENADCFVEEATGKRTLATILAHKETLAPQDAVVVLEHLHEAARQAEGCGLTPVIRNPHQVYVHFIPQQPEQQIPSDKELAKLPLAEWPPFRLRVRCYPLTLNLTQPERYALDRFLPLLPAGVDLGPQPRRSSALLAAAGRDYALLTAVLTRDHPECGEKMRHLLLDFLSGKKRSNDGTAKEFLNRLSVLAGRHVGRKAPAPKRAMAPVQPKEEKAAQPPPTAPTRQKTTAVAAPSFGAMVAESIRRLPDPEEPLTEERLLSAQPKLGPDYTPAPAPRRDTAPVGFAEALFGQANAAEPPSTEEYGHAPRFNPAERFRDDSEPHRFLHLPKEPGIDPSLLEEPKEETNALVLILLVVLIAALIAAVAAHFFGTGFWVKN